MAIFYSHSKKDSFGTVYGTKEIKKHTQGVLDNVFFHFSPLLDLGHSDAELTELLEIIVKYHDLGKYTIFFQNYLLGKSPIDQQLKRHAQIGGIVAYNVIKLNNEEKALLVLYIIFLHHSPLIDLIQIPKKFSENFSRIMIKQIESLSKVINFIETDLNIKGLKENLKNLNEKEILKGFRRWSIKNQDIKNYFLVNYLFSLLVEADKLDASDTLPYIIKPIYDMAVDIRFGIPRQDILDIDLISTNDLRNYCRAKVISNLNNDDILTKYIFTLTAPTGIGKTMTALDFSLKLKSKIRDELKIESRIIYALPFINIIEQGLKEYKDTLPDETNILAHYQYADIFGDKQGLNNNFDGEIQGYNQKMMALDTWQADIVITSFVQFFETLIGNRNKLVKKFNHFAHAIIVLDEVQTLRLDQMPLIGAALFYLSKFLKSRIILMTATKPKIFDLAELHILSQENQFVKSFELLENYELVFSKFHRTKIVPLLDIYFEDNNFQNQFLKTFLTKWDFSKSCLIVCNTVKRSLEIFLIIENHLQIKKLNNRLEYLSTNIVPSHRLGRILDLKNDLSRGLAPILVATQVVEAGVDLDFDMGFRDLGPVDSMIQVAGRINRNNNPLKKYSPLFILDFGDSQKIYKRITTDQARNALLTQSQFLEPEYLKLINKYFDNIAERKSFSQFNKIFESMKILRYDSENEDDRPVSSFRIIEESTSTVAVFVELGQFEIELKDKYLLKIKGEVSKEEFELKYKLPFQQRIIAVPKQLASNLEFINEYDDQIRIIPQKLISDYYSIKTGFIRNNQDVFRMF